MFDLWQKQLISAAGQQGLAALRQANLPLDAQAAAWPSGAMDVFKLWLAALTGQVMTAQSGAFAAGGVRPGNSDAQPPQTDQSQTGQTQKVGCQMHRAPTGLLALGCRDLPPDATASTSRLTMCYLSARIDLLPIPQVAHGGWFRNQ